MEQQHADAARLLIGHGVDVNAGDNSLVQKGSRPLIAPIAVQRAAQVGVGVAAGDMTPLHFAAREGDLKSAKTLVAAGAKVNAQTADGWTPLLIATRNRKYRIGVFLLEQGANPNLVNRQNFTPLYLATDNRNIEGGEYPVRPGDED